jgi:hypothetical protein
MRDGGFVVKLGALAFLVIAAFLIQPIEAASPIQVMVFPGSQAVVAGEAAAFAISVNAPIGWLVNLTAVIPFPCSYSIKPQLVQHSERAIFLLTVGSEVKAGTYSVVVRGQTGGERGESTVKVNVTPRGKLTVNIEPRVLNLGVKTNVSISVSPPVACTVTMRGTNLNNVSRFERGKGQVAVTPGKIETVIIMVEAQGYFTYVESLPVEAPKTTTASTSLTTTASGGVLTPFTLYILLIGGAIIALVATIVLVKVMKRRKRGEQDSSHKGKRRPPPPPPSELMTGAACPTCGTLVDTRFCPKCGTRVRTW